MAELEDQPLGALQKIIKTIRLPHIREEAIENLIKGIPYEVRIEATSEEKKEGGEKITKENIALIRRNKKVIIDVFLKEQIENILEISMDLEINLIQEDESSVTFQVAQKGNITIID